MNWKLRVIPNMSVNISTKDFMGTRTAMFGKTRFGKSNIIKDYIFSIINYIETHNV
jgi:hypothetical protein